MVRCAKLLTLVIAAALGAAQSAFAQAAPQPPPCDPAGASHRLTFRPFATRAWYAPIAANLQDPQSEVVFWGSSRRVPFMPGEGAISIWDISFGKELPIAAWEPHGPENSLLACGGWGIGIWAPISVHLIDAVGEDSSPILNDDYRFALSFKVAHRLTPRDMFSAKIQLGHESTHLGDEFVIRALDAYGDGFTRVNVSFEYVEAGVNWDHYFGGQQQHVVSVRASGVRATAFGGDVGWYSPELIDGTIIASSRVNFEPAVAAEYMPRGTRGWRPFFSYRGTPADDL